MITTSSILETINEIKSIEVFGINAFNLILFIFVFFTIFFCRSLIKNFIRKKIKFFFRNTGSDNFIKIVDRPLNFLISSVAFFCSTSFLSESELIRKFTDKINSSFFTVVVFWFIGLSIQPLFLKIKNIETVLTKDLLEWIINAIKVVLFILGLSAVLEIWGIKVAPIIAGLGLFGVAVALGAQDLFKNLISGVLVLIEKRFKKGDVIIIEGVIEGVVEKIGFRSTAIRKFDKSLCYIPNNQFAENAVTNISETSNRRINWLIGLEYKTTTKQLKTICRDIEELISNNKEDFFVTPKTPVIVKINEFAASSIDILVRCFANTSDYEEFVNTKDKLAIGIKEIVERRKCSFAFPSQSLYIEKS